MEPEMSSSLFQNSAIKLLRQYNPNFILTPMFLTFVLIQSYYQHLGAKIMYVSESFRLNFVCISCFT